MDPRVNVFYWSLFAPDPDAAIIEGRSQEHFQNSHNLIIHPQILKFSIFNNKSEISQQSDFHENFENSQKANRAFFCGCIIFIWFFYKILFVEDRIFDTKNRHLCDISYVRTLCLILTFTCSFVSTQYAPTHNRILRIVRKSVPTRCLILYAILNLSQLDFFQLGAKFWDLLAILSQLALSQIGSLFENFRLRW